MEAQCRVQGDPRSITQTSAHELRKPRGLGWDPGVPLGRVRSESQSRGPWWLDVFAAGSTGHGHRVGDRFVQGRSWHYTREPHGRLRFLLGGGSSRRAQGRRLESTGVRWPYDGLAMHEHFEQLAGRHERGVALVDAKGGSWFDKQDVARRDDETGRFSVDRGILGFLDEACRYSVSVNGGDIQHGPRNFSVVPPASCFFDSRDPGPRLGAAFEYGSSVDYDRLRDRKLDQGTWSDALGGYLGAQRYFEFCAVRYFHFPRNQGLRFCSMFGRGRRDWLGGGGFILSRLAA